MHYSKMMSRIARVLGGGVLTASLVVTMSPTAWAGTMSKSEVERRGVQKVVGVKGRNVDNSTSRARLEIPVGMTVKNQSGQFGVSYLSGRTSSDWRVSTASRNGLDESKSGSYCAPRMAL
ncbi:MAG: hypothetical protein LBV06_04560 [Propionibacteriaceae bacterium]|jgi:hypothetical protein|nr:hypothetical protein [Propionibacteriaceae bacterium]